MDADARENAIKPTKGAHVGADAKENAMPTGVTLTIDTEE